MSESADLEDDVSERPPDDAQVMPIERVHGDPVGATVTLSLADLRELGIEPESTDVIRFAVVDGEARFY